MKLVVGLGNPGKKYSKTRHNIGFMAVDLLAAKHNLKFKYESKLEGFVANGFIDGIKVIILKPSTYMNLSGNSVNKAINYYKINIENVIVVYDDAHLDVGQLRLRLAGTSGGQKGMQSIINVLKINTIKRLKIGISSAFDLTTHVLSRFSRKERKVMDISLAHAVDALYLFIKEETFENIMTKYN